jgi:hypothetical protein
MKMAENSLQSPPKNVQGPLFSEMRPSFVDTGNSDSEDLPLTPISCGHFNDGKQKYKKMNQIFHFRSSWKLFQST